MSRCRSCNADIVWAVTDKNGKPIPLDPDPVSDGNVIKVGRQATKHGMSDVVHVLRRFEEPPANTDLYVSHWATCEDADEWRK